MRLLILLCVAFIAAAFPRAALAEQITTIVRNDAVELAISNADVVDHYGPVQAQAEHKFVVVATEWRNLLGATPVNGKLALTPYLVPDLSQQLFLVINGSHVAPLAASTQGRPGTLATKEFTVADPSRPVRGNLIFDVPADAHDMLLAFLDERYGPMIAQLVGERSTIPTATQKNEIVEAFVANQKVVEDASAPPDTQTVAIDVRLRSIFLPDRKLKCAKVVAIPDWQGRYVQAVADNMYVGTPISGPFEAKATILPEVFLGGEFIFRVPAHRSTLNLMLYFGEMATSAGKVRPRTITLPIKLPAPPVTAKPPPNPNVSTRDDVFNVAITGVTVVEDFAGQKPPAGKKFLLIDAMVNNVGRQFEFFQSIEQLKHVDEKGAFSDADNLTYKGPHPPLAQLLIPPGERRAFQMVFAIPDSETRPRLGYASVSAGGGKVLMLPKIEAKGQ